jgi:hypothetical protein
MYLIDLSRPNLLKGDSGTESTYQRPILLIANAGTE